MFRISYCSEKNFESHFDHRLVPIVQNGDINVNFEYQTNP